MRTVESTIPSYPIRWPNENSTTEVAPVIPVHRSADVTQVYAERDQAKAREIMARIG